MIAVPEFLFLHLSKSGGTFINKLLMQEFNSPVRIGYHLPYREIPFQFKTLPVVGSVRNPWSYYVSWFHFHEKIRNNVIWSVFSKNGKCGFEQTIFRMLADEEREFLLDKIYERVPRYHLNRGSNLTKRCINSFRNKKMGWYSLLFELMYGGTTEVRFLTVENLRGDFYKFLKDIEYPVTPELFNSIVNSSKKNVTSHKHYPEYYSDELKVLVAEKDASIIKRFGFKFET
jgi:hypothetical protein